jgi:CspA family cold shock protein
VPNGRVVHFDRRRGYGFITPDDGGDDVFVHQNNINMEGFRYLQLGERVAYELEVGKVGKEGKVGMKAIAVALLEPRQPRSEQEEQQDAGYANGGDHHGGDSQLGDNHDGRQAEGDQGQERREQRPRYQDRGPRQRGGREGGREDGGDAQRLRRKLERLISVLVEKGMLSPGEIDGLDGSPGPKSVENQQA